MKILILDVIDFTANLCALNNVSKVMSHRIGQPFEFTAQKLHENDLIEEEIAAAEKIIISGSARSAYEDFHWKPRLERALQLILESGKPTYAICFGAQFVAQALGGEVIRNPNGTEFGAVQIQLTEAGKEHPLLQGLQEEDRVHATHNDRVERLPEGAVLLAYNDNSPVQAYQYRNIFASQFHPDLPSENLEYLLELRKERYMASGFLRDEDHYQEIRSSLPQGEAAYDILEKFLDFDTALASEKSFTL